MNIGRSMRDLADTVMAVVPRLLIFAAIVVIGFVVATLTERLLRRLLNRLGFGRLVDHSGLRRWIGAADVTGFLAKLAYVAILLMTLQLGLGMFGPNPVSDLIAAVWAFLPQAFVAVVLVVVAAAIGTAVRGIVTTALDGWPYHRFVGSLCYAVIVGLGVIAALNQVGVATTVTMPVLITVLATVGGIAVVGIGGGLIQPMQRRWEQILSRAEAEATTVGKQLSQRRRQRQTTQDHQHQPWQHQPPYQSTQYYAPQHPAPQQTLSYYRPGAAPVPGHPTSAPATPDGTTPASAAAASPRRKAGAPGQEHPQHVPTSDPIGGRGGHS